MIKPNNYYVVLGWFITDLKLTGNELLIYSIIYGFCQNGGCYQGTRQYLTDFIGAKSNRTTDQALKNLIDKKLITKHTEKLSNNSVMISYEIVREKTVFHYDWLNEE